MDEGKSLSQPVATLIIKLWERPGKIRFIFRAECFRFVEELNFWREIRDTIMSSFPLLTTGYN